MARVSSQQFEDRAYGIQVCLFEVLWSVEPDLTHIHGRTQAGEVHLHFTPALAPERQSQCVRLAEEVIAVAFEGQRMKATFGPLPKEGGWRRLMSQELFVEIAKEVAPWRLQQGR